MSAEDMFHQVSTLASEQDMIIKAAAVADYTPTVTASNKIKKKDGDMSIALKRTVDILKWLGQHKQEHQIICGFSMETENLLENSKKKLETKNCDMICANSLTTEGAGFKSDTNVITLISKDKTEKLPKMTKEKAAHYILDALKNL